MESQLYVNYDVDIGGCDIDSAKAHFEGMIGAIRRPESLPSIRRLPNGRAIARISKLAGRRAHQPAVSFGNWRWAIEPGASR